MHHHLINNLKSQEFYTSLIGTHSPYKALFPETILRRRFVYFRITCLTPIAKMPKYETFE